MKLTLLEEETDHHIVPTAKHLVLSLLSHKFDASFQG